MRTKWWRTFTASWLILGVFITALLYLTEGSVGWLGYTMAALAAVPASLLVARRATKK